MCDRNDEAISEFHKALEIDPNFVLALPLLASAYVRMAEHENAISVIEKLIEITGPSPFYFVAVHFFLPLVEQRVYHSRLYVYGHILTGHARGGAL
jgi:tetratricopeptide (TPR) repeat protein